MFYFIAERSLLHKILDILSIGRVLWGHSPRKFLEHNIVILHFERKYIYLFSPAKAPNLAEFCNPITRQAIELESYPNHPRIQQVL